MSCNFTATECCVNTMWYILPPVLLPIYKHVCAYVCIHVYVIRIISFYTLKCIKHPNFILYNNTHTFHFVSSFHRCKQ